MKIIRCFPSQEAVKGHGRSGALCRINLWFALSGRCFTRYKKFRGCMFHAFTAFQLLDFKLNAVKDVSFTDVSPLRLSEGCGMSPLEPVLYDFSTYPLWNRFCTILAHTMYDFTLLRETCPSVEGRHVSQHVPENQ